MNYNSLLTLSKILSEKCTVHYDQYKSFIQRHNLLEYSSKYPNVLGGKPPESILWAVSQIIKPDEIYVKVTGRTGDFEFFIIMPKKLAEKTLALYSFVQKEKKTSYDYELP